MKKKILVTGAAGFIGFHLIKKLVETGDIIIGLDNINDYYDINLKLGRLKNCGLDVSNIKWNQYLNSSIYPNYRFIKLNLEDKEAMESLFNDQKFDVVINLAAQAGVRYSIENPTAYVQSNIVGFLNVLEGCRNSKVGHLVYASSSSVYGLNDVMPFSTSHNVDHPVSLYAATKKSNELMAHSYSHLYNLPTTGLRFFTVYGPWGRPDMAYYMFTESILKDQEIRVFNHGKMKRDFTYIDDIVHGIVSVSGRPALPDTKWDNQHPSPNSSIAPYRIYNIGNNKPVALMDFIDQLGKSLGRQPKYKFMEMQPGDVLATWADVDDLIQEYNYSPSTDIKTGIEKFVAWYTEYVEQCNNL